MTPEQIGGLRRLLGDEVELLRWRDTVEDLTNLKTEIREADAIAAVLPVEKLAELMSIAQGKPVLQAVSRRCPTGRTRETPEGTTEPEFTFVHRYWQQIIRLELEVKNF